MISPVSLASIGKPWVPENLPAGTVRNDWNPLAQYVTLNAGKVVTLQDTVGVNDMTDFGVAGGRPVYTAAGPGGYPQIDFDGVAQTIGTAIGGFFLAPPFSVMMVYKHAATADAHCLFSDGGNTAFQLNSLAVTVDLFTGGGTWILAGAPPNNGTFGVELVEVNGVNSKIYNNGTLLGTANPSNPGVPIDQINLAAYQYPPFSSLFLACSIARVLLINGILSTANRNLLTNYLRARYALP